MIPFNLPSCTGNEQQYLDEVSRDPTFLIGYKFRHACEDWLRNHFDCPAVYLTKSCTQSLEYAAILLDIHPGDEIIMPSFTYVSTANAFAVRGAVPVYVDILPGTMNMNEALIEDAITEKTKAICVVHYSGVGMDMEKVQAITKKHKLLLIEDAAQCMMAKVQGQLLGKFGDVSCFSFDHMKNITSGQGGAVVINNPEFQARGELLIENGTNKKEFLRGDADFYEWKDLGSNFHISELQAAYLFGQLENAGEITANRLESWELYQELFEPLRASGKIELAEIPDYALHNAHIYFIKVKDREERSALMKHLTEGGVHSTFHFVPLHSTTFGKSTGRFVGADKYTTKESLRLLRLPVYNSLGKHDLHKIVNLVYDYYKEESPIN